MNIVDKQNILKEQLCTALRPIIGKKCVLLDVPYHENIGDYLIWQGTENFLRSIGCECIYRASYGTYRKPVVGTDVTILFLGGGNWGDTWRVNTEFKVQVIQDFPDNNIIILPNTVFYEDKGLLQQDIDILNHHSHITFCARDKVSYALMKPLLHTDLLLLPDLAFYLPIQMHHTISSSKGILFIHRTDKELSKSAKYDSLLPAEYNSSDWPTFNQKRKLKWMSHLPFSAAVDKLFHTNINRCWCDFMQRHITMPYMVRSGIQFIAPYSNVYATRMHGAILAALMGKQVYMFDNSYGKNSNFYHTWLDDVDNVTLL